MGRKQYTEEQLRSRSDRPSRGRQWPRSFDIPVKTKLIDTFRAFRDYLEKNAAALGRKLGARWYVDSPEERPELYEDQPEVLAAIRKQKYGHEPA